MTEEQYSPDKNYSEMMMQNQYDDQPPDSHDGQQFQNENDEQEMPINKDENENDEYGSNSNFKQMPENRPQSANPRDRVLKQKIFSDKDNQQMIGLNMNKNPDFKRQKVNSNLSNPSNPSYPQKNVGKKNPLIPKYNNFQIPMEPREPRQPSYPYNGYRGRTVDKELWYDESQRLKQHLNITKDENTKLRTSLMSANAEIKQLEKTIEQLYKEMNNENNPNFFPAHHKNHLIMGLKRQIKSMKEEIREKDEKVLYLSRNIKSSKIQELEVQSQMYSDECIRLRHTIEEMYQQQNQSPEILELEQKLQNMATINKRLENENRELNGILSKKDIELRQIFNSNQENEKKIIKANKSLQENSKFRKENVELKKIVQNLKERKYLQKEKDSDKNYKKKVMESNEKLKQKNNQIKDYEKKISLLENQINDLKDNFTKELSKVNDTKKKAVNIEREKNVKLETQLLELQSKYGEPQKGDVDQIIEEEKVPIQILEIKNELRLIRLNLQLNNIDASNIVSNFNNYQDQVSTSELQEILESSPFNLNLNSDKVTEYLMNQKVSNSLNEVLKKLKDDLGDYRLYNEKENQYIPEIKKKICPKIDLIKEIIKNSEYKNVLEIKDFSNILNQLSIDLSNDVASYIEFTLYKKLLSIDSITSKSFLELLKDLNVSNIEDNALSNENYDNDFENQSNLSKKSENENNEKKEKWSENIAKSQDNIKEDEVYEPDLEDEISEKGPEKILITSDKVNKEIKESVKSEEEIIENYNPEEVSKKEVFAEKKEELSPKIQPSKIVSNKDVENMDEDEMLNLAQKCFISIANKLKEKNIYFYKFFSKKVKQIDSEGEMFDVITPSDFIQGLKELNIESFSENEIGCIINVLAMDESATYLKVSDIVQILEDYGIKDPIDEEMRKANSIYDVNFDNVDKVTLVLLLALTEYLIKAKVPLYSLMQSKINVIKDKANGKDVEVIKTKDFYTILNEIGINIDDSEHENLNSFLSLSSNETSTLSMLKLKKAIEEIATNEELNNLARNCYAELVGEEDDPNDSNINADNSDEDENFREMRGKNFAKGANGKNVNRIGMSKEV